MAGIVTSTPRQRLKAVEAKAVKFTMAVFQPPLAAALPEMAVEMAALILLALLNLAGAEQGVILETVEVVEQDIVLATQDQVVVLAVVVLTTQAKAVLRVVAVLVSGVKVLAAQRHQVFMVVEKVGLAAKMHMTQ
ncbi:hypothetical protein N8470_00475 [bacterium]|nr:hypothetical protein [bacterium]